MHKRFFGLIFTLLFSVLLIFPAEAKFRDAINFDDSRFVKMQNMEMLHRYQKFSGTENNSFERTSLKYQLTYGVLRNFEMGINIPVHFYEDGNNGIGDAGLYQKFLFTEQGEGIPRTSGGFELIFPSGDEDELVNASDELDARLFFTIDNDFNKKWRWLLNAGYHYYGQNKDEDRLEYNAALRAKSGPR
ncbi:MAG: transporter, partial [bacterium]